MATSLYPISRKFDDIFDQFTKEAFKVDDSYPVYNIYSYEVDECKRMGVIEIAVTGLGKEDIQVYEEDGYLVVEGTYPKNDENGETVFVHRGLSKKDFTRKFWLDPNYEVGSIKVKNGLMKIFLKETSKNKKFLEISG